MPERTLTQPNQQAGFSLVEIAVVLLIIGLVLGGLLVPLSAQVENSRRKETRNTADAIVDAVDGFAMTNGRLPCPDTDGDGAENPAGGVGGCTSADGTVPYATLGVGEVDGWQQTMTYRVTLSFADDIDGTGCGTPTAGVSFSLCSVGDIQILNGAAGTPVASQIPLVVVSHGANWAAFTSADETENSDNDAVFISHVYSKAAGNEYDDIAKWVSPNSLKSAMVNAGRLP